jgi:flagellar basal-body rod protein FlgF
VDKVLYLAMTGAREAQVAQSVTNQNLANASTTGFKSTLAGSMSVPLAGPGFAGARTYAMTADQGTDVTQGPLLATGRDLDVAVDGAGWIAVQSPDGTEAYTRAGNLSVDAFGRLTTDNGRPVLGNSGPIAIPPYESIQVGADGTISIRPIGSEASALAVVDRVRLVNPPQADLVRGEDGLMRLAPGTTQGAGGSAPDANVKLVSGMLEGSNVNVVTALVDMIQQARNFELHVKMMSAAEDNDRASTELLKLT